MIIHTVTAGETAESVAAFYGVDPFILAFDNDLEGLSALPQGAALAVTVPTVRYSVAEGDTLYGVARRFGASVDELRRNNLFIGGDGAIFPGQTLYITVRRDPLGEFLTGGYAYPFIPPPLLYRSLPSLSSVTPFTYGFRSDGTLVPPDDVRMINAGKAYGVPSVMHLSTLTDGDVFSVELATELLNDGTMQARLLDSVLANMNEKGYAALDVDFEFLGVDNAEKYADFITYCVQRLHPSGYGVLTALAPKTYDTQPGLLYEGHDYALLGAAADAVLLMTYEWGYTYGPPMAVSPITPVGAVVDYALTRIPANKILLGISVYGYDFVLPYVAGQSKAASLSTSRALALASAYGAEIFYDSAAQAPFFDYSEGGTAHRVWFEDVRSVSARLALMAEKGLAGAVVWNLDRDGTQNLVALNGLIDRKNFDLGQSAANPPQNV